MAKRRRLNRFDRIARAARRTPRINPNDPYVEIHRKFNRIRELRRKLNATKVLYVEHDALVESMLPYFITAEHDRFTILRQITLGSRTYRLTPFFYDERRAQLKAKTWKSTAHETFTIA